MLLSFPPPLTVSDAIVLHAIFSHPNDIYSPQLSYFIKSEHHICMNKIRFILRKKRKPGLGNGEVLFYTVLRTEELEYRKFIMNTNTCCSGAWTIWQQDKMAPHNLIRSCN